VIFKYNPDAAGFVIYAKMSQLDIRTTVSIMGDQALATKLPAVLTSIGIAPLQHKCATADIEHCHWVIGFTTHPTHQPDLGPAGMILQPGFTLIGSLVLLEERNLLTVRVSSQCPSQDADGRPLPAVDEANFKVTLPGSDQPAKFTVQMETIDGGLAGIFHRN
jgi:hypothetical protein